MVTEADYIKVGYVAKQMGKETFHEYKFGDEKFPSGVFDGSEKPILKLKENESVTSKLDRDAGEICFTINGTEHKYQNDAFKEDRYEFYRVIRLYYEGKVGVVPSAPSQEEAKT